MRKVLLATDGPPERSSKGKREQGRSWGSTPVDFARVMSTLIEVGMAL